MGVVNYDLLANIFVIDYLKITHTQTHTHTHTHTHTKWRSRSWKMLSKKYCCSGLSISVWRFYFVFPKLEISQKNRAIMVGITKYNNSFKSHCWWITIFFFFFCIGLETQLNGPALGVLKHHYIANRIRELLIGNSRFLIYNLLNQLLYYTV